MERTLRISNLNDFIFCPASIYYHGLYEPLDRSMYQQIDQIRGSHVHESIDRSYYSTSRHILQGIDVYTMKYNLVGKIDIYDVNRGELVERKHNIITIYDGYIFQLYAQYFGLKEQGYCARKLKLYSYKDNKSYVIAIPQHGESKFHQFETLINEIRNFDIKTFYQKNTVKCERCIYSELCVKGAYHVK